jgi:RNA polymerase sigma-70 factor (ECF subfamily)
MVDGSKSLSAYQAVLPRSGGRRLRAKAARLWGGRTAADGEHKFPIRQRFEQLVQAEFKNVYRFLFWLCRDEALAKDLSQETFLRAWKAFPGLRDPDKANAWLMTTARREYFRYRGRDQVEDAGVEPDDLAGRAQDPADDAEAHGIRRAIGELPLTYREPLVLQVLGGYTGAEIAEILGLSRNNVDQRIYRARRLLKQRLDGSGKPSV